MDARKAVIGSLAGRWRRPIARRRKEARLPVKVQLVEKGWCAPCGGAGRQGEGHQADGKVPSHQSKCIR